RLHAVGTSVKIGIRLTANAVANARFSDRCNAPLGYAVVPQSTSECPYPTAVFLKLDSREAAFVYLSAV
ncbi:MAG: hypothetical protein FWB91_09630, partial [Defluviitaleaceae bacterium]|nr:hypothetical protein [Defluviitaleaceae bacterium]